MAFTEYQRQALLTNLARDKAENLRREIARLLAEHTERERPDLTPEQRARAEAAMRKALESSQRMLDSLGAALKLAEQIAADEAHSGEGGRGPDNNGGEDGDAEGSRGA